MGIAPSDAVYCHRLYVYGVPVKTKLTITIDEDLIPVAKEHARSQRKSLSGVIESALRSLTAGERVSFAQRWRGRFRPANRKDDRYKALAKKYL